MITMEAAQRIKPVDGDVFVLPAGASIEDADRKSVV